MRLKQNLQKKWPHTWKYLASASMSSKRKTRSLWSFSKKISKLRTWRQFWTSIMKRPKRVNMWSSYKPMTISIATVIWLWLARPKLSCKSRPTTPLATLSKISNWNLTTSCTPKRSRLLKSKSKLWRQLCELKKLSKDTSNSRMSGDTWKKLWLKLNSLQLVVKASRSVNRRHSSSRS